MQMTVSDLPVYGAVSIAAPAGDPFFLHTSRKQRVPCTVGRLHHKRFYRKTPVAERNLTDRTQTRTAVGTQPNPVGWTLSAAFSSGGKLYTGSICREQNPLLGHP